MSKQCDNCPHQCKKLSSYEFDTNKRVCCCCNYLDIDRYCKLCSREIPIIDEVTFSMNPRKK